MALGADRHGEPELERRALVSKGIAQELASRSALEVLLSESREPTAAARCLPCMTKSLVECSGLKGEASSVVLHPSRPSFWPTLELERMVWKELVAPAPEENETRSVLLPSDETCTGCVLLYVLSLANIISVCILLLLSVIILCVNDLIFFI